MFLRILLFPFSLLFGIITFVRNKLFDWGCLPTVSFDDLCVIGVGNITVGGTGKTPFVEYLIRMLADDKRVAVLSRGYKRHTKGFMFVENTSAPGDVGDEPYQIKQKFPGVVVAVDADRVRGISEIRKAHPGIRIVVLDDAFQYRSITPVLSILLADYNRPMYRDSMLPGGRLREWACFAARADMLVVTKSPAGLSENERKDIIRRYTRYFPKEIFFTSIGYGEPLPVFVNSQPITTGHIGHCDVLLVTGIANPKPFDAYIGQRAASVQTMTFPDHHDFSEQDISNISIAWENMRSHNKLLITTEKDAVRLQQMDIAVLLAQHSYYIPIEVNHLTVGLDGIGGRVRDLVTRF